MDGGTNPAAGWHPDPHDPTQLRWWDGVRWTEHLAPGAASRAPGGSPAPGADAGQVFVAAMLYGLGLATITGAVSGTVAAPVLGTILGAIFGASVGLPISLVAGAVIAAPLRRAAAATAYRRRVDVTLIVLGLATAALAAGWISLRALVGPWPALTMLAVVVIGLLVVRPRLQKMGPPAEGLLTEIVFPFDAEDER
jgi:hypothetical protein